MTPAQAAHLLGVSLGSAPSDVRQAYRTLIGLHHPDRAGAASQERASAITEAFHVLSSASVTAQACPSPVPKEPPAPPTAAVVRRGDDTIVLDRPPEEAFGLLLAAAHDVGEVTYLDRSMPILEVLCRFEGEPATSLVLTIEDRSGWTEVLATVESIEARPAPPASAVVDLLELALHRRQGDE